MSLRPDGTYRCDSCGNDIGNAGYMEAVTISGADPSDLSIPRVLHLCVGDGATGCQYLVLNATALAYYTANK